MPRRLSLAAPAVVALAVAASLALGGCGGSSTDGNATPSDLSPAVKAKWDAYCAARVACLPGWVCASSVCIAGFAEEGPLIEFIDCQNAKMCGASEADCKELAGAPDAEREAFIPRCEAALLSYQMMAQSVPNCHIETSACALLSYSVIRKQYVHAFEACLTVPCEDLRECLNMALAPLACAPSW